MKRIIKASAAALGIAMTLGLVGCGAEQSAPAAAQPVSEITVSASGDVRLVPDKATVSFGVTTQEATAEEAQSKNSEAVDNVIAVLTKNGVEEKSIRTSYYNMYPQYDYSDGGEQRIIGYVVTTSMSVQDQNIEDLGKLLSACVSAGINNVESVSFLCSGYDEAYRRALAKAVAAAREKAEALAAAAGKTLGDVVNVTEGWQDTSVRYGKEANTRVVFAAEAAMDTGGPSFQPGETQISASVTVSYRMN